MTCINYWPTHLKMSMLLRSRTRALRRLRDVSTDGPATTANRQSTTADGESTTADRQSATADGLSTTADRESATADRLSTTADGESFPY